MNSGEIAGLIQQHFGNQAGFNPSTAQQVSNALEGLTNSVSSAVGANNSPTSAQQQCYTACAVKRDAALAAAAAQGFPLGLAAAAAAITAFNACRHQCDAN